MADIKNDPRAINDALFGLTYLHSMHFSCDSLSSSCHLKISVGKDVDGAPPTAHLHVEGVSGLCAQGLGGGFTQLCCLQVKDVSHEQHDRIRYEIADMEDEALKLRGLSVWLVLPAGE